MAECPVCFGDGQIDCRDSDASLGEALSDAELDALRAKGMIHPVGILRCDECEGTGVVTDDRLKDIQAVARASVDQAIAEYERRVKAGIIVP